MRKMLAAALAIALCAGPALAAGAPPSTGTNVSSTVSVGGTFQSILVASNRLDCFVQNPVSATETLFVFFGPIANATTANSVNLAAGQAVTCSSQGATASDQVSVTAATSTHAFVAYSRP
jgi:hypothetical protein